MRTVLLLTAAAAALVTAGCATAPAGRESTSAASAGPSAAAPRAGATPCVAARRAGATPCVAARRAGAPPPPAESEAASQAPAGPTLVGPAPRNAARAGDIPRFAARSPFAGDYRPPEFREPKRLWARSCLYEKAPDLVVEEWIGPAPETAGKYVLVEFWATWCPPSRRSIALLNRLHERFGRELVVIALSDQPAEEVRALREPKVRCYSAVDTQARMKRALGVFGIPHAILIEPGGYVVWEGFPLQKGYELTEAKVEKILAVGRKRRP